MPHGFTGPETFRWEPHVPVRDVTPVDRGDYSAGPMQTLATTARWVIGKQNHITYNPFRAAPHYRDRPAPEPHRTPLYNPVLNIDVGCAEIVERWNKSGEDPVLVAACYNAGGLYATSDNRWGLRSTGNHLDRAAQFFGDACAVMAELKGRVQRSVAASPLGGREQLVLAGSDPELAPTLAFTSEQMLSTEANERYLDEGTPDAELEAAEAARDAVLGGDLSSLVANPTRATAGMDELAGYLADFEAFLREHGIEYFEASELLYLGAGNASGECKGLNDLPDRSLWPRVANTALMIDEIRRLLGHPIIVISGYRSPAYNTCVGGASSSLHVDFNALDFRSRHGSPSTWAQIARDVRRSDTRFKGGIGVYSGFLHIDTRGYEANWTG